MQQQLNKNNTTTKPQTKILSSTVKIMQKFRHEVYTYYTRSIQQTVGKNFLAYYESVLNISNSSAE
jgi:hypothetical protein